MATHLPRILLITLTSIFVWPSLAPAGRPAVLVNPHVQGHGTATTIQEGIDMVDPGGKVMVLPGTYEEAVVIDKGLTLEAVGGESGPVIVAPAGGTEIAVEIATNDPGTIRGVNGPYTGISGIRGDGPVGVPVEPATPLAGRPPPGATAPR